MEALRRGIYAECRQQPRNAPRVLGNDQVGITERFERTLTDVAEIAYGGGDNQ